MKIPKLAKGGTVSSNPFITNIGEVKPKPAVLFKDKYYEIYKRTKNRRIKKKQLKKSWKLQWFNSPIFKEITDIENTLTGGDTSVKD